MNLALFDFDGTITTVGTFPLFCRYVVRRPRLIVGGLLISPWLLGYKLGIVSNRRICAILAAPSFLGQSVERIDALGAEFARTVIPPTLHPPALERIEWHKARGDLVVIVSASLSVYLAPWCASMAVELICTELAAKHGRLTGGYVDGDCCAEDKVRRIRQRYDLSKYETIYAYGDSDDDRAMLALADKQYFRWKIRPSG
jgi:HAD superfamily hydrolase (TIGR01490 family)